MKRLPRFALFGVATLILSRAMVSPAVAIPGAGRLLGTDAGGGNLLDISPSTGEAVVIGSMGVGGLPSLATDPSTGIIYAAGGGGDPILYIVDPTTGVALLVGDTGLGSAAVGAMDFDGSGTLYAAVNIVGDGSTGSDHLATIDTSTGHATIIGPFGTCEGVSPLPSDASGSCTINGIEGIAFDPAGVLWGAHTERGPAGEPGLYFIDPRTGSATFAFPVLDVDGIPPSGGLSSIQFSCDGTLFGGTARSLDDASDGGRLVTIDPVSGRLSFAGAVAASEQSLGALAFEDSDCPVTTPDVEPRASLVGGGLGAVIAAGARTARENRAAAAAVQQQISPPSTGDAGLVAD